MTDEETKKGTPSGQLVGYIRVSSLEQNTARQLTEEALGGRKLDEVFTEHVSGKSTSNRPQLAACLKHLRAGDTLVVHEMSRLARSLSDLLSIVEGLTSRGVKVEFLKEHLTFSRDKSDPYADMMLQVLGAVGQLERAIIHQRMMEGVAIAKEAGKYKGRGMKLTPEQAAAMLEEFNNRKAGVRAEDIAKKYGISRVSLYAYLKQQQDTGEATPE